MISYFQKFKSSVRKWLWKSVDRDKAFWAQCVDWVKQYCAESGYPITTHGNAIDLWEKWLGDYHRKIAYKAWLYPQPWDIVIQSWPTKYGHIFVADVSDSSKLNAIEQNAGTWNWDWKWGNAIRKHTYTYKNCLGWFTHK